jgi:acyl-CoA synthetase (AMP-forming)/AMP-acid ligase II
MKPNSFLTDIATDNRSLMIHKEGIFTYSQFAKDVASFSNGLSDQASSNTVAVINTGDHYEMLVAIIAAWKLEIPVMPMPESSNEELLEAVQKAIGNKIEIAHTVTISPNKPEPDFYLLDAKHFMTKAEQDVCLFMLTSGSTGQPKVVPIVWQALHKNITETAKVIGINENDRIFMNLPTHTMSAIHHLLTLLSVGGSYSVMRGFTYGKGILENLRETSCTGLVGVPATFIRMLPVLAEISELKNFRFFFNSGEHLPTPIINSIREGAPKVSIFCVYGLTEVAGRLCILPEGQLDNKSGSVGHPIPGMDIIIKDDEGHQVQPNIKGEVWVKGPCLFSGYLGSTGSSLEEFATGDIGHLDDEGYLFLEGRKDDIFKVGGEKVSVIKEALYGDETLKDFMVKPHYDELIGNVPCLHFVPKPGTKVKTRNIVKRLRSLLPDNHIPKIFIEVDAISRTSIGKKIRR